MLLLCRRCSPCFPLLLSSRVACTHHLHPCRCLAASPYLASPVGCYLPVLSCR
ncbi:hypothetical protein BVRB_7g164280 [Beta vulgaris subsp. vulgaris]|nr:hypothetical protein BVRB_7g164280 [Beta vulgaris subsp. vulgaris]